MDNTGNSCELKAGHPPAVKAGNMRIRQRTKSTTSTHSEKDEQAEAGSTEVSFAPKTVVDKSAANSGVPESEIVQNKPEAVKHFHEKPQPAHEFRNQSNKPAFIQQPKK